MASIKDFKYKLIKNFLTTDELEFLKIYVDKALDLNWVYETHFSFLNPCWYNDVIMNVMLEKKLKKMTECTGLELLPTYAYWRYYIWGAELPNHTDRSACEISATVNINDCGNHWPIYVDERELIMHPGDAVIYLGKDCVHGRKKFNGDFNAQLFMHYVDKNGLYTHHSNDQAMNEALETNDIREIIKAQIS